MQKILMTILASALFVGSSSIAIAANSERPNFNKLHPIDKTPLFVKSTVFGTVYVDRNQNGIQDEGEEGVVGVILATVSGLVVTTDQHGRYTIPDISGGRDDRGSNFLIKLDKNSLPSEYKLLSSQAESVRLSPGMPQQIDFRLIEK